MVPCAEEHHTVARHSGVTTSLSNSWLHAEEAALDGSVHGDG